MMMKPNYAWIMMLLLSSGWLACSLDEEEKGTCVTGAFEYLIFGSFYGECIGEECIEMFKVDMEHLFEDTLDLYPNGQSAYTGVFVLLSDAKRDLVKDIIDEFPSALLQEENTVIGMPDAGDWGGKYVEWKVVGSEPRFWLLDNMESNMPQVYNEFVDRIEEKLFLLHQ